VSNIDQPHGNPEAHDGTITAPSRHLSVTESVLRSRPTKGSVLCSIVPSLRFSMAKLPASVPSARTASLRWSFRVLNRISPASICALTPALCVPRPKASSSPYH